MRKDATLFSPIELSRGFRAKNRLIRSATWDGLADDDGRVTDKMMAFYLALAEGGVGTVVTGLAYAEREDQPSRNMLGFADDEQAESCRRLCAMMHDYDCRIVCQLAGGGNLTNYNVENRRVYSPSSHPDDSVYTGAEEMTVEEIQTFIRHYAEAAVRIRDAGFDAVQLHGAHGYLISQFLTPRFNQRTDEYGGSLENRARFLLEVYDATRAAVGEDYPIWIKINCDDFLPENGFTFAESRQVCRWLTGRGIDLIEVSGGHANASSITSGPIRATRGRLDEGFFLEETTVLSKENDVPFAAVGGYRSFSVMEDVLTKTPVRMISMSRALICEPDLPNRLYYGVQDAAHCFSCTDLNCLKIYGGLCRYEKTQLHD